MDLVKDKVILIGGASGVGKSTLAKRLSEEYEITHRLGTGFIREITKVTATPEIKTALDRFTFEVEENLPPHAILRQQAQVLFTPIKACIDRAIREGTPLIIEGNHLIPELYQKLPNVIFIVLHCDNPDTHFKMINSETHFKREVTPANFKINIEIQDWLKKEASTYNVPLVEVIKDDPIKFIRNLL